MKTTSPQRALIQFPRSHVECVVSHAKGNRFARRLLSLFEQKGNSTLDAIPRFHAQWHSLIKDNRAAADCIAWRLVKVANRPLGRICQPSHVTSNHLLYCPQDFRLAQKSI